MGLNDTNSTSIFRLSVILVHYVEDVKGEKCRPFRIAQGLRPESPRRLPCHTVVDEQNLPL